MIPDLDQNILIICVPEIISRMSVDHNKALKNYPISKELKSCSHFPHIRLQEYIICVRGSCADPEGWGQGSRLPLENHKTIGFLSSTGLDPLKITKPLS